MKIVLSRNELLAAAIFASTNESRYVLNGICVEVKAGKKPTVITTDGRRLCVIETLAEQVEVAETDANYVLRSDFIRPICALSKAFGGKLFPWIQFETTVGSQRVAVDSIGGNFRLEVENNALVEGEFPKWRQVVPRRSKKERVAITDLGINPEFVGDFAKAAKLLESKTMAVQTSLSGGAGESQGPIEVKLAGVSNFYGLIMPCVADDSAEYQPEFVSITKQIETPEPENDGKKEE